MDKEIVRILNAVLPDSTPPRERAEYVTSGVALNMYMAVGTDDITVNDLDQIFRMVFRAGFDYREASEDNIDNPHP
jgi:hypothetical protein